MSVIESTEESIQTPRLRVVARRTVFWIVVGSIAVLALVIGILIAGSGAAGERLSPTNPAPAGTKALVSVLADHGVHFVETDSLADTEAAIVDPEATTLVIFDLDLLLDDGQLRRAAQLADSVVLIEPDFAELRAVAPEVAQAGAVAGLLTADCELGAVQRAGKVSGGGFGYRVIDDEATALACLGSGDEVYSLVQLERDDRTLSILGATDALTNEFIIFEGNAAFALGLLGEHENLVWYTPSFTDVAAAAPPTTADLTPAWVIPSLSLLALTAIAAAVWRGRRFGPIIIENLPVTVRASETMRGRARLYGNSSARLRALDALRIGAVARLASATGLPRLATVDEVIASVAAVTGRQPHDVRRLLVDEVPTSDAALVRLSDDLLTLEHAVATAVRPD